jgi:hypothetical protein
LQCIFRSLFLSRLGGLLPLLLLLRCKPSTVSRRGCRSPKLAYCLSLLGLSFGSHGKDLDSQSFVHAYIAWHLDISTPASFPVHMPSRLIPPINPDALALQPNPLFDCFSKSNASLAGWALPQVVARSRADDGSKHAPIERRDKLNIRAPSCPIALQSVPASISRHLRYSNCHQL